VSFEITETPTDIYVCHCSICRRYTGAANIPVVVVKKENFRWLSGADKIASWHKPGHDWSACFCQTCGSPLPAENSDTSMYVPAGLFVDQQLSLKVAHHIWVKSKARWEVIGDEGVQHPEAYGSANKDYLV